MNKLIAHTIFYLREYFFPLGCGGCGEALLNQEDSYYGLCAACRDFLSDACAGEKRCSMCGRPLITEREFCLSCRQKEANAKDEAYKECLAKLQVLFPYTGKFRAILGAYKFAKSLSLGNFLAGSLSSETDEFRQELSGEAAWVPVPPRPGKIKKQGWDQIEYLAGLLEKNHGLPMYRCLRRLPSRSQKELNKEERGSNLKGRILCTKQPPKTAIIFDDVITTGATLEACASALREGGAEKVYGVCLFYD
jgi:ComF family protein